MLEIPSYAHQTWLIMIRHELVTSTSAGPGVQSMVLCQCSARCSLAESLEFSLFKAREERNLFV